VIVSEEELRNVHDRLYRMEAAVEDVQSDLAGSPDAAAYRAAVAHLLDAAQDLVGLVVESVRQ
jgi:hypothetical protein